MRSSKWIRDGFICEINLSASGYDVPRGRFYSNNVVFPLAGIVANELFKSKVYVRLKLSY